MATDPTYGHITVEHGEIPDVPAVLLLATDPAAPAALDEYRKELARRGASKDAIAHATDQAAYVKGWQRFHPELVRLHDGERYIDSINGGQA
jgi:hypothetical protein